MLAESCEFDNINNALADQILASCSSTRLKEKILREETVELKDILAYGRAIESSKQKVAKMTNKTKTVEVNTLKLSPRGRGWNWQSQKPQGTRDRQRTQSKTCRQPADSAVEFGHTTDQSLVLQKVKRTNRVGNSTIFLVYAAATHVPFMTMLRKATVV